MPFELKSRAIVALRMSGMALSRNAMMSSFGHAVSGFDQSSPEQASARSGRIAATAPASHGCGSSAVMRMSCSDLDTPPTSAGRTHWCAERHALAGETLRLLVVDAGRRRRCPQLVRDSAELTRQSRLRARPRRERDRSREPPERYRWNVSMGTRRTGDCRPGAALADRACQGNESEGVGEGGARP
jgi:hypothetical protein